MSINRDAWLQALHEVNNTPLKTDPNVITSTEFGEILGCGRCAAARALKRLVASGKAEPTRKMVRRSDGMGIMAVPAYRLKTLPRQPLAKAAGKKR